MAAPGAQYLIASTSAQHHQRQRYVGVVSQRDWANHAPHYQSGKWVLAAGRDGEATLASAANLFTKTVVPTRLDRVRMELVNKRAANLSELLDAAGNKLLILRGRGGTGKTIRLLQLARRLSEERGARVLMLTYNRALVADIRRLLTILGISDDISSGTVQVQTLHSFLHAVLCGLGVIDHEYPAFLEKYEELKENALNFLREGAVSSADIEALTRSKKEAFLWDNIFVDEGQDWPENERDLLFRLYPFHNVVVRMA